MWAEDPDGIRIVLAEEITPLHRDPRRRSPGRPRRRRPGHHRRHTRTHWTGPRRACRYCPTTPARMTHDYVRNGTTSLFAAMDLASGSVIAQHYRRHCHQEFLRFLKLIDDAVPAGWTCT